MRKIVLFSFFIFLFFLLVKSQSLYAFEIVVSNQALEKIVREGVDAHKIYTLQRKNEDFHFYEPTFSEWQKIKNSKLVIIVGSENWAKKVYNLRKGKKTFSLAGGETRFKDPHLWFDLERVKNLIKELVDYLSKKEPEKKEFYQKREDKFLKALERIKEGYKGLRACKYKEIYILGHPVFEYLLKEAGIKEITLLKGYHKEGEPSIKELSEIYNKAKISSKIVFLTDPEFERYKEFFEKRGIKVIKLWSGGTYYMPGSYTQLLEYNLKNIKKALGCK